jgi:hypothetical protein
MDPTLPVADCLVSENGRIKAIGESGILSRWVDDSFVRIDLKGRLLLPGFIDSHTHFAMYSLGLEQVSLEGTRDVGEALQRLQAKADTSPAGEWIFGVDWNKNIWPGGLAPTKEDADIALPHHPLAVISKCGHLTWGNSLAFQLAGIHRDTPDPEGGEIERHPATGEPTGILKENAAELIHRILPKPDQKRIINAIKKGMEIAYSKGLVGIHNCEESNVFAAFEDILSTGSLPFRVHHHLAMGNLDDAIALGIQTGFGSPSLNIGSLKLFADGALGSQTASMLDPFEGTADDYGIVVNTKEDLLHMMKKAAEAGISSAVHAIGDKANKEILDIYEAIFPISQAHHLRQRIEHAQLIEASDFPRFRNLNVIASVQPLHATSDMDIVDKHWGARGKGAYAFKTFIQHGITSAYGSDVPVETFDPIKGIFAAVSRHRETMLNIPAWYPDQRLSPHEAVFGYTAGAAYASYEDNIKGTLTVGKLADMVVLSKDIFKVPEEEILETTVDLTIIDGKIVYAHQI